MKITNRKFFRDYQLVESYEAGISLNGAEVKSVRAGHMRLDEAFVRIVGHDVFLINADIQVYQYSRPQNYDPRRSRRLLLHKKEIIRLRTKLSGGGRLTVAPVSCYNKGSIFKLEIALARGRGEIEKKKLVKARDERLAQKREAKEYMKV